MSGIRCRAIHTTAEWKCISILICRRMLSLCITWASRRKHAIWWYAMSRRSFLQAGRSTPDPDHGITRLSGAWPEKIRISMIWTTSPPPTCAKRNDFAVVLLQKYAQFAQPLLFPASAPQAFRIFLLNFRRF